MKNVFMYQKKLMVFLNFLGPFFCSVAKIEQRRSKDGRKDVAKMPYSYKKVAKMDPSALRVYSTYTPSADEPIFAAIP